MRLRLDCHQVRRYDYCSAAEYIKSDRSSLESASMKLTASAVSQAVRQQQFLPKKGMASDVTLLDISINVLDANRASLGKSLSPVTGEFCPEDTRMDVHHAEINDSGKVSDVHKYNKMMYSERLSPVRGSRRTVFPMIENTDKALHTY